MAQRKPIIGVMGPGKIETDTELVKEHIELAMELGKQIASAGWLLLTGGRNLGVMHSACLGAKMAGGVTIGIVPGLDTLDVSGKLTRVHFSGRTIKAT